MASRLKALLGRKPALEDDHAVLRRTLVRREKLVDRILAFAPYLRSLLILAGLLYTLALPYKDLGRKHYISENALQPGQVNTYWNWADVHIADINADKVAKWSQEDVSVEQRTVMSYLVTISGINTYAILHAPKTDGAEALVLSASWLSRATHEIGHHRINTRGVALVLALANYFKKHSMWSKDIIFVIGDDYVAGTQAWLDAYHGFGQDNLHAEPLKLTTGPIWAALNLDYPHHSFSHAGIYYEGANGHLPNLDFINSASRILRNMGIPPLLHSYDPAQTFALPSFLASLPFASHSEVQRYAHAARNLIRQVALTADGRILGPEGTFGKYRIDAITLFGVPAEGSAVLTARFDSATESLFRTLNNLLERFHQSFFLYIMTSVDSFIAVGNYLAAPVLLGAGMTIQGLMTWAEADGREKRDRPVALVAIAVAAGAAELRMLTGLDPAKELNEFLASLLLGLHLLVPLLLSTLFAHPSLSIRLSHTLRSLALLLSGLLVSVTATLNFGLSLISALHLALVLVLLRPLAHRFPRRQTAVRRAQQLLLAAASPTGLWALWRVAQRDEAEVWARELLRDWHVGGGWSLPVALALVDSWTTEGKELERKGREEAEEARLRAKGEATAERVEGKVQSAWGMLTGDQEALNQGNVKAEEGEWKRDLADGKVPVPSAERVKGKVESAVGMVTGDVEKQKEGNIRAEKAEWTQG
ncbi:hypothetical protein Rhopal_007036-T1 [Rhodotorula paludigena]|uniref:Uncharacterized protein n=1 Tax=Rhodotorula paludigena TaxID=86838 RepID=A0AAV5GUN8_9BASI|nr:hypothetical protein Rhopal_007036-T1 [Rhodotorula paludigena]